jgi:DNA-binding SARP family transcriptional activator
MDRLRIYLFEQLRVYRNDEELAGFPTAKAQHLFCYLILRRNRCHARGVLAGLFWGDSPEEQARKALRTTLWRLRAFLEPPGSEGSYLIVNNEEIGFNRGGDYWLDVEEFERRLVPRLQIERAIGNTGPPDQEGFCSLSDSINLYRGDLLEGCHEDWCLYERERLQGMFLHALTCLMLYYRHQGRYDQAIGCGQRILSYDPLMEEVHREMMRLHALNGNRGAALRQYRLCRDILTRELGIEPMDETDALYAQICTHAMTSSCRTLEPTGGPPSAYTAPLTFQIDQALNQLRLAQTELRQLDVRFQKGMDTLTSIRQQFGQNDRE